jgi:hypothetical protein
MLLSFVQESGRSWLHAGAVSVHSHIRIYLLFLAKVHRPSVPCLPYHAAAPQAILLQGG